MGNLRDSFAQILSALSTISVVLVIQFRSYEVLLDWFWKSLHVKNWDQTKLLRVCCFRCSFWFKKKLMSSRLIPLKPATPATTTTINILTLYQVWSHYWLKKRSCNLSCGMRQLLFTWTVLLCLCFSTVHCMSRNERAHLRWIFASRWWLRSTGTKHEKCSIMDTITIYKLLFH